MKAEITHHAGKGSQETFLPRKKAVNALVRAPSTSINDYAKATPNVVRNGPNVEGDQP